MLMRKSSKYLLVLLVLLSFSACTTDENEGANSMDTGSSEFVSAEVIEDINASTMLSYVKGGIDANATNAFAYKAVKITYNTLNQNDEAVVASGLLVIPTPTDAYKAYLASLGKSFSVSMLCDNHGTIFLDSEAPSNVEVVNGVPDYALATLMTGYAGFAGIYPDYIGYGESQDVSHPYILKKASVRASLDMIKASMKYMLDEGIAINYQLYISGYSQGGHLAMALAQEVENSFDNVTLKGVAPMAAPHDVEALANIEINASHTMVYPAFLGYLANSYAYYYEGINLSNIVVETNTTKYQALFDGTKNNIAIHTALGLVTDARGGFNQHTADALFKEEFINDYQNNANSLIRQKFIENKSYDSWTPRTKVNLIHCFEDEIIPFSMSQNAFNELNATGADITLSPIPNAYIPDATPEDPFVHGRCASVAYGATTKWFADIRSGVIQ